ncbi:YchJ family protein [Thauera sp. 63]|uniref:YchJ family protein n=1 Tax=Thauera sp. 63 TaxID=497321 RepID=UPI0003034540|nr:YchJ family metal-binding protein [Thauera sp. 63]
MKPASSCPCGSGHPLEACCGPIIAGQTPAGDARTLMRSRYTAFVLQRGDYLLATWHPDTRPANLELDEEPRPKWIGLEVRRTATIAGREPPAAEVEFVARYRVGGRAHRLHETSRFLLQDGRWYYVDGIIHG